MPAEKQEQIRLRAKTALLQRGLTITELALKVGFPRSTVSVAINHGKFPNVLRKVSRELSIAL